VRGALAASTLALGVAVAIACGGSGSSNDGTRKIETYNVVVASRPCQAGYEHAIVCCNGGNCVTRDSAPFHSCDGTAYPDGLRCCSLNEPTRCTTCDPKTQSCGTSGFTVFGSRAGGCAHCPPGYSGDGPLNGTCCQSNGSNCFGSAGSGCAGTGCPPAPAPCAPVCAPGFTLSGPQVDVCCHDHGQEGPDCYVWLPADPNAMSCGTAGTTCGCRAVEDGHDYQMDCDDATKHCACAIDGAPRATFSPDGGTCEGGTQAAWKQCGFP
jgi:hypothetical protein